MHQKLCATESSVNGFVLWFEDDPSPTWTITIAGKDYKAECLCPVVFVYLIQVFLTLNLEERYIRFGRHSGLLQRQSDGITFSLNHHDHGYSSYVVVTNNDLVKLKEAIVKRADPV